MNMKKSKKHWHKSVRFIPQDTNQMLIYTTYQILSKLTVFLYSLWLMSSKTDTKFSLQVIPFMETTRAKDGIADFLGECDRLT